MAAPTSGDDGAAEGAAFAALLSADLALPRPCAPLKPSSVIRVFVSSSFKDHYHTRRVLNEEVFPPLRAWCADRGQELLTVDLQWGVPEGTNSLDACFGELTRCAGANGAPFFLYLGGQRFGWAPSAEERAPSRAPVCGSWVPGASVTAMEVLEGGLRARNPRALYFLRAPEYLQRAPHAEVPLELAGTESFIQGGSDGAKQRALWAAIEACALPGSVVHFDPAPGSTSAIPSWHAFASVAQQRLRALIEASPQEDRVRGDAHAAHARLKAGATMPRAREVGVLLTALRGGTPGAGPAGQGLPVILVAPSGSGKTTLMAQAFEGAAGSARLAHFCGLSGSVADLARRVARAVARHRGMAQPIFTSDRGALDTCMHLLGGEGAAGAGGSWGGGGAARQVASGASKAAAAAGWEHTVLDVVARAQAREPLLLLVDAVNQLDCDHLAWLPPGKLAGDVRVLISCTPVELECLRAALEFVPEWRRTDKEEDRRKGPQRQEPPHAMRAVAALELPTPAPADLLVFLLGHESKRLLPQHVAILTRRRHCLSPSASPLWIKLIVDVLLQEGTFESLGDKEGLLKGGGRGLLLELAGEGVPQLTARLLGSAEQRCGEARVSMLATLCTESLGELSERDARARIAKLSAGVVYDAEWSRLLTSLTFLWQPYAGSHALLKVAHVQLEEAVRARYTMLGRRLAVLSNLEGISMGSAQSKYAGEQWSLLESASWEDLDKVPPSVLSVYGDFLKCRSQFPRIYVAIQRGALGDALREIVPDCVDYEYKVHTAMRAVLEGVERGMAPLAVKWDAQTVLLCSEDQGVWGSGSEGDYYLAAVLHDSFSFYRISGSMRFAARVISLACSKCGFEWPIVPLLVVWMMADTPRWLFRCVWVLAAKSLRAAFKFVERLWTTRFEFRFACFLGSQCLLWLFGPFLCCLLCPLLCLCHM